MGASSSKEFGSVLWVSTLRKFMWYQNFYTGVNVTTTAPNEVPMYGSKCKPTFRIALYCKEWKVWGCFTRTWRWGMPWTKRTNFDGKNLLRSHYQNLKDQSKPWNLFQLLTLYNLTVLLTIIHVICPLAWMQYHFFFLSLYINIKLQFQFEQHK